MLESIYTTKGLSDGNINDATTLIMTLHAHVYT